MSLRTTVKITPEEAITLGFDDYGEEVEIENPFVGRSEEDVKDPLRFYIKEMQKPENFYFVCKYFLNVTPLAFQLALLKGMWHRTFPMLIASRGGGKSFLLALYAVLRAFLRPGTKVILVGAVFRQAKQIFEYCERIYNNAPILRELTNTTDKQGVYRDQDRWTLYIGDSTITAIPMGDGTTIRGLRANVVIADEFAFLTADVYETVVEGFTATNQDVIAEVQKANLLELLYKRGEITRERKKELESGGGNQSIIAGTAEFQLNHFYEYWVKYTNIIRSRGNEQKLDEAMKGTERDEDFDWKDYAVYRIPYNIIPRGLLSGKAIARAKATLALSNFLKEYAACFPRDSQGYYPRSLIDSCVTKLPIELPLSGRVQFNASLKGNPNLSYIIGVDPASESDNFAIVVLECHPDHRRLVYSWTVKRKKHKEYYEQGKTDEFDFFNFCARKIRTLMELFPNVVTIGIDKQGGGIAVMEALGDSKNLDKDKGELPIFVKIDPDPSKRKLTDGMTGMHIIEEINFSKEEWRVGANQGMKFDLENKQLLFPAFNPAMVVQAMEQDSRRGKNRNSNLTYESLEDCILDIEELKSELTTIIHTQTESGKDKWSTPEIKLEGGKKGRMVKDRYTALLIANMIGRQLQLAPAKPDWSNTGAGIAQEMHVRDRGGRQKMYSGNDWYNTFMENLAGIQEQTMYERGQL